MFPNLNRNIINLIKKYISTQIYTVLRKYESCGINRSIDLFATYSTYERAYNSVFEDLNKIFKKYRKYLFSHKEKFTMNYYNDYDSKTYKLKDYIGSTKYTTIYTKIENIGICGGKDSQYIYEIQEQYLNANNSEGFEEIIKMIL